MGCTNKSLATSVALLAVLCSMGTLAVEPHRHGHADQNTNRNSPTIHLAAQNPPLTRQQYDDLLSGRTNSTEVFGGTFFRANYFEANNEGVLKCWTPANWTDTTVYDYDVTKGQVTVTMAGIYEVYSQVMYVGRRGGQMVKVQRVGETDSNVITQCLATIKRRSPERLALPGSCYTGRVIALQPGDRVWIQMAYRHTAIRLSPINTFWGLVLLSTQ